MWKWLTTQKRVMDFDPKRSERNVQICFFLKTVKKFDGILSYLHLFCMLISPCCPRVMDSKDSSQHLFSKRCVYRTYLAEFQFRIKMKRKMNYKAFTRTGASKMARITNSKYCFVERCECGAHPYMDTLRNSCSENLGSTDSIQFSSAIHNATCIQSLEPYI